MINELKEDTKFKIGDRVEATWASGRTSIHTITGVEANRVHGTWYQFLDEDGYQCGLYGEFLSAYYGPKEGAYQR